MRFSTSTAYSSTKLSAERPQTSSIAARFEYPRHASTILLLHQKGSSPKTQRNRVKRRLVPQPAARAAKRAKGIVTSLLKGKEFHAEKAGLPRACAHPLGITIVLLLKVQAKRPRSLGQ